MQEEKNLQKADIVERITDKSTLPEKAKTVSDLFTREKNPVERSLMIDKVVESGQYDSLLGILDCLTNEEKPNPVHLNKIITKLIEVCSNEQVTQVSKLWSREFKYTAKKIYQSELTLRML